jgi:hypothetical protein
MKTNLTLHTLQYKIHSIITIWLLPNLSIDNLSAIIQVEPIDFSVRLLLLHQFKK